MAATAVAVANAIADTVASIEVVVLVCVHCGEQIQLLLFALINRLIAQSEK